MNELNTTYKTHQGELACRLYIYAQKHGLSKMLNLYDESWSLDWESVDDAQYRSVICFPYFNTQGKEVWQEKRPFSNIVENQYHLNLAPDTASYEKGCYWSLNVGGVPDKEVRYVYWFSSALSALSFTEVIPTPTGSFLIATGPEVDYDLVRSMIARFPLAKQVAAFDSDKVSMLQACRLLTALGGLHLDISVSDDGQFIFTFGVQRIHIPISVFSFNRFRTRSRLRIADFSRKSPILGYETWWDFLQFKASGVAPLPKIKYR